MRNFFKTPVFWLPRLFECLPVYSFLFISLYFFICWSECECGCVSPSLSACGSEGLSLSESLSQSLSLYLWESETECVSLSVFVCVWVCCHLIHPSGRAIELCFRCWGCTCAPTQDVRNRGTIKIFYLGKCVEGTFVHLDLRSCQSVPATILFWCGCGCGWHWVRKWVHSFFIRTIL